MSHLDHYEDRAAEAMMRLDILNERPIASAELGELFTALARDYKRVTRGRTLVVAEITTGSIYASLADAAVLAQPFIKDGLEIAKAIKGMTDFGRTLYAALGHAKAGGSDSMSVGRKRQGEAAADAILKMAETADAEITLRMTPEGLPSEMQVTPVEAIRIREAAATERLRIASQERQARLDAPATERLRTESVTKALLSLPSLEGGPNAEIRAAVAAIVGALRDTGYGFALSQVAQTLLAHGRSDLAALVLEGDGDAATTVPLLR